jgi:hypothetical protein
MRDYKNYDNIPSLYDNASKLVNVAEGYSDLLDRMIIIQERQQQAEEPANIFDIIVGGGFFVWLLVWLPLSYLFGV